MERYASYHLPHHIQCSNKSIIQYIALERLEAVYKSCNLVGNICVHASSEATQPMAIIIPHEGHLRQTLQQQAANGNASSDSLVHKSLPDLCHDAGVKELMLKQCNAIGKKNGFKQVELLQAVILTPEEWTPETGLVTAAQKIQRSKIAKAFEAEIKARFFFPLPAFWCFLPIVNRACTRSSDIKAIQD